MLLQVAEVLLGAAADVNASAAKKAQTPLLLAAAGGNAPLVQLVLQVPTDTARQAKLFRCVLGW